MLGELTANSNLTFLLTHHFIYVILFITTRYVITLTKSVVMDWGIAIKREEGIQNERVDTRKQRF